MEPPAERRREERNFAANAVPIGLLAARIVWKEWTGATAWRGAGRACDIL